MRKLGGNPPETPPKWARKSLRKHPAEVETAAYRSLDANAQRDPPLVWHLRLALGHPALDFRGTADGIHHPRELGQEAVASVLDDAAPVR
jgi:hypothetical protein